jgi:putative transposase
MSRYLRPRVPGATVFFTVALADRTSDALTRHVDALRTAVRATRTERPFHIDAWVVLPDHLHAVWTLPEGDADYATRWGVIKARFSRAMPHSPRRASHTARATPRGANMGFGNGGSGNIISAMTATTRRM